MARAAESRRTLDTDSRGDRLIKMVVHLYKIATRPPCAVVEDAILVDTGRNTVHKKFAYSGIFHRIAKRKPLLTGHHKAERLPRPCDHALCT